MRRRSIDRISLELSKAVIEIDNYQGGRPTSFSSVRETAEMLRECLDYARKQRTFLGDGFYNSLTYSLIGENPKNLRKIEEATLELGLLVSEIDNVENLPNERLEELRKFLIRLGNKYLSERESNVLALAA